MEWQSCGEIERCSNSEYVYRQPGLDAVQSGIAAPASLTYA